MKNQDVQLNVFGEKIIECSCSPMTGFFRSGCCETSADDLGSHTICTLMTEDFLLYSKKHGNDLMTPMTSFGFPGLVGGDRWCLCAPRWQEAYEDNVAPKVFLAATHIGALHHVELDVLKKYAIDLS